MNYQVNKPKGAKKKTMLFQGSTTTNQGKLTVINMTNDGLSNTAVYAIGKELLDEEEVDSVSVKCTVSADKFEDNEFDVYDTVDGGSYLFSVVNDGTTWNK